VIVLAHQPILFHPKANSTRQMNRSTTNNINISVSSWPSTLVVLCCVVFCCAVLCSVSWLPNSINFHCAQAAPLWFWTSNKLPLPTASSLTWLILSLDLTLWPRLKRAAPQGTALILLSGTCRVSLSNGNLPQHNTNARYAICGGITYHSTILPYYHSTMERNRGSPRANFMEFRV